MYEIMMIILGDLLLSGLSALLLWEYFKTFFPQKETKIPFIKMYLIHIMWHLCTVYAMEDVLPWFRLLVGMVFLWISGILFQGNIWVKMIFSILYVAVSMLTEALTGSVFLIMELDPFQYIFLGSVLSKVILWLFLKALQFFFHHPVIQKLSWKMNFAFLFLPIGSMFLVNHIFSLSHGVADGKIITVFCTILVLLINFTVFYLYIRLSESMELKHKNLMYEKEFELLKLHQKEKQKVMLEFQRKKHDFKHQMMELLYLMEQKELNQLQEKILELADLKYLENLKPVDTDASIIQTFLHYKSMEVKEKGVDFKHTIEIPEEISFGNSDLCILLGNAIDNALEAAVKVKNQESYIDLKIMYDTGNLIILLENSFDGVILKNHRGERITRKEDRKNHGIGIGSIKGIIEKYHGYYEVEIHENVYSLNMVLYGNETR